MYLNKAPENVTGLSNLLFVLFKKELYEGLIYSIRDQNSRRTLQQRELTYYEFVNERQEIHRTFFAISYRIGWFFRSRGIEVDAEKLFTSKTYLIQKLLKSKTIK